MSYPEVAALSTNPPRIGSILSDVHRRLSCPQLCSRDSDRGRGVYSSRNRSDSPSPTAGWSACQGDSDAVYRPHGTARPSPPDLLAVSPTGAAMPSLAEQLVKQLDVLRQQHHSVVVEENTALQAGK